MSKLLTEIKFRKHIKAVILTEMKLQNPHVVAANKALDKKPGSLPDSTER